MRTNEIQKMRPDEAGFLTALVVIEMIILPLLGDHLGKYGGGVAMFAGAVIGLAAYLALFGRRLRSRGQMKLFALVVGIAALSGAVLALALAFVWRG